MVNFNFYNPARIIFGKDTEKELPAQMFFLQVKRVVQTLRQYSQVWESQRSLNLSLTV